MVATRGWTRPVPGPNLLGKAEHDTTGPSGAPEVPEGLSRPVERLLSDARSGKISRDQAHEFAVGASVGSQGIPVRYRVKTPTRLDLQVLALTGAHYQISDESDEIAPSHRAGPPSFACQGSGWCELTGRHTAVLWPASDWTLDEQLDVDPADGRPDHYAKLIDRADQAWDYFKDDLGMEVLDPIVWHMGAMPGGTINCPAHIIAGSVEYLAIHETFHQFQWTYLTTAVNSVHFLANYFSLSWWIEASASWATK